MILIYQSAIQVARSSLSFLLKTWSLIELQTEHPAVMVHVLMVYLFLEPAIILFLGIVDI